MNRHAQNILSIWLIAVNLRSFERKKQHFVVKCTLGKAMQRVSERENVHLFQCVQYSFGATKKSRSLSELSIVAWKHACFRLFLLFFIKKKLSVAVVLSLYFTLENWIFSFHTFLSIFTRLFYSRSLTEISVCVSWLWALTNDMGIEQLYRSRYQ